MPNSPARAVPFAEIELGPRWQPATVPPNAPRSAGNSTFTVHYNATLGAPDVAWLNVTVGEAAQTRLVVPRGHPGSSSQFETIDVPGKGEMPVAVVARNTAGDIIARVAIRLHLIPDYAYWIVLQGHTHTRPTGRCIGNVTAVPLLWTGSPPESLFVWTGSIGRGAIYC